MDATIYVNNVISKKLAIFFCVYDIIAFFFILKLLIIIVLSTN